MSTEFNKYVLGGQAADLDGFTTLLCTFKHVENITHGSNQTVNKAWMNESIGGEVFFGTFWDHWFQSRLELVDVMNDIIPQSIFPMKFKVSS